MKIVVQQMADITEYGDMENFFIELADYIEETVQELQSICKEKRLLTASRNAHGCRVFTLHSEVDTGEGYPFEVSKDEAHAQGGFLEIVCTQSTACIQFTPRHSEHPAAQLDL